MSTRKIFVYGLVTGTALAIAGLALATDESPGLGKPVDAATLKAIDISVGPSGATLPAGSGNAVTGATVYAQKCASCHGPDGKSGKGLADPLVGGTGSLATAKPVKTVGSFWPYATTLFDYTRRAMPLDAPQSLSDDEVYAVSAYVLKLNGIIGETDEMNASTLPKVKMPNQKGFISDWPLN